LEKIAKKIAPSKVPETVSKLTVLNGIKDPKSLQVGQVLKVPA
jgi:nucleoid-associated protein YgaU